MTEQIYINGVRMDVPEDNSLSLIFQSPYFTDLDSIVSNRTTAVDLPSTPNNLRAIEQANLEASETAFAYNKHRVVYVRDGLQVFSGLATLQSIAPTTLRFSFVWGNVSVFQKMLETNLRDLQTGKDYVSYNDAAAAADDFHYPPGWKSRYDWGTGAASVQPIMPVGAIISRLQTKFRVQIVMRGMKQAETVPFKDYGIPLIYRNADDESRRRQGVEMGGTGTVDVLGLREGVTPYTMTYMQGATQDLNGMAHGALIDVGEIDRIRICVPAGFQTWNFRTGATGGLRIISTDETGVYFGRLLRAVKMARTVEGRGRVVHTVEADEDFEVDTRGISYIALLICSQQGPAVPPAHPPVTPCGVLTPKRILVYDPSRETLTYGGNAIIPLYRNLPDWTVSDFLKNLMKIEGLFAYSTDEKTIVFVTIGDLYAARRQALDWTDRIVSAGGAPTETTVVYGSFARRNWFKWAEDETVKGNHNGYIDIDNENLDQEIDLVTVDFAPTEGNRIPVWSRTEEGASEWQEVEPRILKLQEGGSKLSFDGLDWPTLIDTKYRSYRNMIAHIRSVKVSVALDTWELTRFDATIPVYVRQWGHYYAVMKLTAKGNGLADAELLQMGRARVWPTVSGTSDNPDALVQLKSIPLATGGHAITLVGEDQATIREYIDNPEYCLVLLRYGYARRGELGSKMDKVFGLIGTHTTRNHKHRQYRKGLRYRVIGHDILKSGKLAGQTARTARYSDATLVFDLLQEVKLPAVPTSRAFISRDGRIRNTASRGTWEIYVALVKKVHRGLAMKDPLGLSDYGCVCVSNILQVRGINPGHKSFWEFKQ